VPAIAFHFNVPDKLAYACRLARKALHQEVRLVIACPAGVQKTLSPMLWAGFAPTDFLAHACDSLEVDEGGEVEGDPAAHMLAFSPIVLLAATERAPHHEALLNLGDTVPAGFARFARVIEIVAAGDAQDRQHARARWKHYAACGHAIARHDIAQAPTQ